MPLLIVRNDITRMKVDAIVNAANTSLLGGGGVDGAIHAAAGPELLAECRTLHSVETGQAKLTRGYRLPAKYVIHTAGPVWQGGKCGEEELLASCYRSSLSLAAENGCESVAFPLISSGVYGYPKDKALEVATSEIRAFLSSHDMTVYIVAFTRNDIVVTGKIFHDITELIDDDYASARYSPQREALRSPLRPEHIRPLSRIDRPAREDIEGDLALGMEDSAVCSALFSPAKDLSLDDMLAHPDESFAETLLRRIDERHLTDAECYRRANIDRRLFNKIKVVPNYRPGKSTALALALALELSLDETQDLLEKAGYTLSRSNKTDIVVEYCIRQHYYDVIGINQILFAHDLELLGY